MDYASGKPLPSNQEASTKKQSPREEEDGANKNRYFQNFQMQRKNSVSSSFRKSYSRSHSGDMSNLIQNKIEISLCSILEKNLPLDNKSGPI